jgi:hypothetical protein
MTTHWNVEDDHLISRWSNGEGRSRYHFDWMKEASVHEEQRRTHIVDMSPLSPFGGARWYAHALWDHLRPESCLS